MDSRVWVFAGLALLLTLTPGADTALVIRSTLARGRTAALLTVLGICTGLLIHSIASALGLSLLLSRSAVAFDLLKMGGAVCIAWLGVQSLRAAVSGGGGSVFVGAAGGALRQSVLLGSIHIVIGLVWLSAFAIFLEKISGFLLRDKIRRRMEAATGLLLMALGLRLALEKRVTP